MKARLFKQTPPAEADVRPTLLGVVTLMFLLLFFLLATSSGQRLAAITLGLPAPESWAPLPHSGLVQSLTIQLSNKNILVIFELSSTDIAAAATTTERHERALPAQNNRLDSAGLLGVLNELHTIDPSRTRAILEPDDPTTTEDLLLLLDIIRGSDISPLFPEVTLGDGGDTP